MKRHDLHFIHIGHNGTLWCESCRCQLSEAESALAWTAFEAMSGASPEDAYTKAAEHDASLLRRAGTIVRNLVYGLRNRPRCVVIA